VEGLLELIGDELGVAGAAELQDGNCGDVGQRLPGAGVGRVEGAGRPTKRFRAPRTRLRSRIRKARAAEKPVPLANGTLGWRV
jgi:hypothetical protein